MSSTPAPRPFRELTGPRGKLLMGAAPAMVDDSTGFLMETFRKYGDTSRFRFGPIPIVMVAHPADVKTVFIETGTNFNKHTRPYLKLKELLGNGLLTSEGETWKRHRRICQPAFHHGQLTALFNAMVRITEEAVTGGWLKAAAENRVLDMHHEMSTLTLRIVGNTLLGTDVTADQEAVAQALDATQREFDYYIARLIHAPRWIPGTIGWKGQRAQKELQGIVRKIIERRRKEPSAQPNLLSLMMAARDEESGQGLTDRELADEVLTFMLAGHETTANALTWTLLLLSQNPVCQRRLRDEAQRALPGTSMEHRHLGELTYTECVIKESMRLYPPAWIIERGTAKDAVLGGHHIPKGTMVFVSPYVTHRHPTFWENPEGFDPERFSPERSAGHDKYQYIPFGGGSRVCIGSVFAMMEAQIILALTTRQLQFDLLPGFKAELDPLVTLRPRNGLPMRVRLAPQEQELRAEQRPQDGPQSLLV